MQLVYTTVSEQTTFVKANFTKAKRIEHPPDPVSRRNHA